MYRLREIELLTHVRLQAAVLLVAVVVLAAVVVLPVVAAVVPGEAVAARPVPRVVLRSSS